MVKSVTIAGGRALKETSNAAILADVVAVEPSIAAESVKHLTEELAAALVGGFAVGALGGLRWGCREPGHAVVSLRR